MKAIQTTNNQGGKLSSKLNLNFNFKNNHYIKYNRNINKTGLFSAFTFLLLALTCLFPISKSEQTTEAVTGTVQSSSLTLNVSKSAASVELDVNSMAGTFASSNPNNSAIFTVTTNNFSGYTLSISGNDDEGKLYDQTKQNFLSSLSSATTETDFSAINKTDLNGKWGYKPSKFNSNVNEDYLPAPTTEASTIDTTATANATANNYSISLGIRADYTTLADTYTNTFTIIAVPNPIAYVITYDANTTDTVSNMPAAQNSTTSATSITLSDKTPTRENYDFKGWCTVAPTTSNPDTCAGTAFQPGDTYGIDQTSENVTTLYAMWKIERYTLTVNAGDNITMVTGTGTYNYGETVTLTATKMADTTCDSYAAPTWTMGAGASGTLSATSGTSITYTMGASNDTITVTSTRNDILQKISFMTSNASTIIFNGNSYSNGNSISVACGTYSITGIFPANYGFLSWSTTAGTVASTSTLATTYEVSDVAVLRLTGAPIMQNFTKARCSSLASSSDYSVVDSRDSSTYTVRYINGNCWMTQNLRLSGNRTLTSSDSNVASNYTLPNNSLISGNSYTEARLLGSSNVSYGYYYNYCAATAGTICASSSTTRASYDICPKNWRLPTSSEQSGIAGTSYTEAYSPVTSGFYNSGRLNNSFYGFWWSSTALTDIFRYYLVYDGASNLNAPSIDYAERDYGLTIRCIRSS